MSIEVYTPKHPNASSVIKHLAWDSSSETLAVMFHSGSIWIYRNISIDSFQNLKEAKSLGAYFNKNIRDICPSTKVGNIHDPALLNKGNAVGKKEEE